MQDAIRFYFVFRGLLGLCILDMVSENAGDSYNI